MNHYQLIDEKAVKIEGKEMKYIVTIAVDTRDELQTIEIQQDWLPGSQCLILDTHEVVFLNSKGEWK